MVLLAGILALGMALGLACSSRPHVVPAFPTMPILYVALLMVVGRLAVSAGFLYPGLVLVVLASVLFMVLYRRVPGAPLLGLGALTNWLVVVVYGGMPVLVEAAGLTIPGPGPGDGLHAAMTGIGYGVLLADILPVPGPLPALFSLGDMMMMIGVLVVVVFMFSGEEDVERRGRGRGQGQRR